MTDLPLFSQPKTAPARKISMPFRDKWRSTVDVLINEIRAGASRCEACDRSGLGRQTFYNWMKRYDDFAQLVHQAAQQGRTKSTRAYTPYRNSHDPSKIDELIEHLNRGLTLKDACSLSGISRSFVHEHKRRDKEFRERINHAHQYTHTGGPKSVQEDKIDELIEHLNRGLTLKDACSLSGVSQTFVHEHKRRDKEFRERINHAHQYNRAGKSKSIQEKPICDDVIDMGHSGNSYLYIVSAEGCSLIKIGVSSRPRSRLKALQCGSPLRLNFDLLIKGAGVHEAIVHAYLKSKGLHSHGEWFQSEAKHETLNLLANIKPDDDTPERDVMAKVLTTEAA